MPTALPVSAAVDTFMQSANQAAMQTNLALVPGTNVQAYNATLAAVAGGTYTGASSITTLGTIATGVWNGTAIAVANGGTGATDSATARTNLGLAIGTNVQAYNATLAAVAGGTYTGAASITTLGTIATGVWNGTAIAVANGGTGATDAGTARTNLGLGTIATQAASAVSITGGTLTGMTGITLADGVLNWSSNTTATPTRGIGSLSTSDISIYLGGARKFAFSSSQFYALASSPAFSLLSNTAPSVQWGASSDVILTRASARSLQMGFASATPATQSFAGQPGSGANITGSDFQLQAGNGTGTGGSGKLIFQTAPSESTGSTANTMATALEIDKDRVFLIKDTNAAPSGTPSGGGYLYVESGALKYKGSSGTVTTLANA